jgi:hypothetical protein
MPEVILVVDDIGRMSVIAQRNPDDRQGLRLK